MKTILFSFIFCLISVCLNAQSGTLDSSFGVDGKVITNYPNDYAVADDAAVLKDNTLIVTGDSHPNTYNDTAGILLLNYLPDGELNSNFGNNGKKILYLSPYNYSLGRAISVLPDGKILVAGYGIKNVFDPNDGDLILVRFNAEGTLDSTFGYNGFASKDFGTPPTINDMQIQPDGKILIGGALSSKFFLTRYNANGTIDENFGSGGYVLTSFSQGVAEMNCISVEPDGEILTAGSTQFESAFAQYMPNGSLNGKYVNTFNAPSSNINSIAMENDGSFIAAGVVSFKGKAIVAKFKNIGVIDLSFGTNGSTIMDLGSANSVYLQADKKIVVAGTGSYTDTGKFMVFRLLMDGMIDSSFGTNGMSFANFGVGYSPVNFKGFPDNTGKIVLAGNAYGDQYISKTILLARYNNDLTKRQIIINKIKHYISTHNNADAAILNKNITLYPNPVQNILTIKGLDAINIYQLIVNNSKGSVVATKQISNLSTYQFNVQNLSSSIYYLNVVLNNKIVTTLKFVKE